MILNNSKVLQLEGLALYHTFLKHSQWWDEGRMREYQQKKLKRVIDRAWELPFYRTFWGEKPERFEDIPILTKEKAREMPLGKGFIHTTSGSTGEKFSVAVSRRARVLEDAFIHRHWTWAGYEWLDGVVMIRSYAPKGWEPYYKFDRFRNYLYLSPFDIEGNGNIYADWIDSFKPKIVRGYPSSLFLYARHGRRPRHQVSGVITSGETLTEDYRNEIEKFWGAKVFDWYGQAEITANIVQCEMGGYHPNPDYAFTEVVGRRIVATNLHNLSQPLIRYDTGDLGEWDGTCSCHRAGRLIKCIAGRSDDFLTGRDGRVPSINFYTLFKDIDAWQLVQYPNGLHVKIRNKVWNGDVQRYLYHELRARLGDIPITFDTNPVFFTSADGKKRAIIRRD